MSISIWIAAVVLTAIMVSLYWVIKTLGVPGIIIWFAHHDKWWSPVRMIPGGGRIKMMTKGIKPGGDFAKALYGHIPYLHHHEGDHRLYHESDPQFAQKFPNGPPSKGGYLHNIGVVPVGFLRQEYKRERRWDALDMEKGGTSTEYKLVRKEMTGDDASVFYFATPMAIDLETVPARDSYPVQGKLIVNILLIHPEKAEFVSGKWETQGIAAIRTRAREYIGSKTIHELREERDTDKRDDLVDHILLVNSGDPTAPDSKMTRLVDDYGIMVQGPYFYDLDLESGDEEINAALKKVTIERENLVAERIRADQAQVRGEGKRKEREEEAAGIRATVEAWGANPVGAAVVMAEALRENKTLTQITYAPGANTFVPVGGK